MNILDEFEKAANRRPSDIAVVHRGKQLSYAQLHQAVRVMIAELLRLGIEPGQKVGHLFPNCPEHFAVSLGIVGVGAVVVFLSPLGNADAIAARAQECHVDAICYAERLAGLLPAEPAGATCEVKLFNGAEPAGVRMGPYSTSMDDRRLLAGLHAAVIGASSGTTGTAKGIVISHSAVCERAMMYHQVPRLEMGDAVLWIQPLGRMPGALSFLFAGVRLVIGDAFEPNALKDLIRRERVTQVYTAPMFYRTILQDDFPPEGLDGVRYLLCGGTALGEALAEQFSAKFGREIVEHYGLTETGRVFINESQTPAKRGSIGLPVRSEAKLQSSAGQVLEGEAAGKLLVRCASLFDAYVGPWRGREEVLIDGWLDTGDLARRDADGYYWIVGRVKEMINVAGIKVFPKDIEAVLMTHETVEEALVYGAPDRRFGEVPLAKVKLRAGTLASRKELLEYVNDKLPLIKSLRGLELVESIAKTETGKVKRLG